MGWKDYPDNEPFGEQEPYQTLSVNRHSKQMKLILFWKVHFYPDLTVMNSLSRSWSVWWDNQYGSDCWVSWGTTRSYKWVSNWASKAPWVTIWNSANEYLRSPDRHASSQNQERPGCSGEAEGVWRHPPALWQGKSQTCKTTLNVYLMPLSVMLPIFPYMPCLSLDSDIKSNLRHATAKCLGCAVCFCCLNFNVFPQRKRMVVPAALKIVRLKPSRKVSVKIILLTIIWVWQWWALYPETDHLIDEPNFWIRLLSRVLGLYWHIYLYW